MPLDHEKDLKIDAQELTAQDKKEKSLEIPRYMSRLELKKEDQERIINEICQELDAIDEERKADNMEQKWEEMDNLYNGKLRESGDQQFNLSKRTAKIKVAAITRACEDAFFDVDPRFSISPRPEFDLKGGEQVTEKQEDFLDYKFDEVIPLKPPCSKVFLSAGLKGTGILRYDFQIKRVSKKREESYGDKNEPGLTEFINNYPDCQNPESKYHPLFIKLKSGQKINFVAQYKEVIYNDPMPKYVNRKDFYVRRAVEGYEGLCRSRFHAERMEYSYYDLKKLEEGDEQFYNIDELIHEQKPDASGKRPLIPDYDKKDYPIFECIFWTKLKEDDKNETRCVFHVHREKKVMIGSIHYPYYDVDAYYIPFHVKEELAGFDQPGVGEDLKDTSIAEDAILNFTLEGWWLSNQVTPITQEGSEIESQFLEKRWAHGVPLTLKVGEQPPDFLSKYMKPMDASNGIQLIQYLIQGQDDLSGVSSLISGRESPVDPTAPAAKTLALLERSGINIKAYIRNMVPSFNLIAQMTLKYYDQMSREGLKYRVKRTAEAVTGASPFGMMSRSDLRAKTTIQSQASAFNFNKNNEKREDLALFSTIRNEPLVARNPKAVYELLKNMVKGWSPKWRNRIDKVLPSFEDFQREQAQAAVQAVALYVQQVLQNAKVTGQPPAFDPIQLMTAVQDFVAQTATAPDPEVVKAQEKQAVA